MTEFCTYGSLFDFLHSMDWMVTDERLSGLSGLSGTTQSYIQDRMSQNGHPSLASSATGTSVGKAAPSMSSQGSPLVELQGTVGSNPLNLNVLPPQTSDTPVWHNFTQLATPPASPAPSPALNYPNPNHKRLATPGLVSQLFTSRQAASDRRNHPNNNSDPDLEAGGNELHGLNTGTQNSSGNGGGGSPGGKLRSSVSSSGSGNGSGSLGMKGSSSNDLASKLADALTSHYTAPEHGGESRSDNGRGSWSNSFRNVSVYASDTKHYATLLCSLFGNAFLSSFHYNNFPFSCRIPRTRCLKTELAWVRSPPVPPTPLAPSATAVRPPSLNCSQPPRSY